MVYGFVRQSGGQVLIVSTPERGTTVCIDLPRTRCAEGAAAAPAPAPAPRLGGGETILFVDDESTLRGLVAEALADLGYTTIAAEDGSQAMAVLRSDRAIDLLVTDVGLPGGMNGRQLADAARMIRPDMKVLFVTGYAENTVLSHGGLAAGMAVLTKPFTMDALSTAIRGVLAMG